jgi:ABC-2 type transport system ATP-binding protein
MEILGRRAPSPDVMNRVGFLSENPYIYPYLTPREFVTLCARLSGLSGSDLSTRVESSIARVAMTNAIDRAARTLSKGMLQRVALAAALVHDPELLILDEPMSGLDPVGRKEVRDLIVEERQKGHTVFFSSHILSDVELLCDRVCILRQGRTVLQGSLHELLHEGKRWSEVTIGGATPTLRRKLEPMATLMCCIGDTLVMDLEGDATVKAVIEQALGDGARLDSVTPKRETLEDLFVREAL